MISVLLQVATKIIAPVQILFSVYLMLRGHNQPGGGFIGGLVAASAFALYAIAYDVSTAKRILRFTPQTIFAAGLLLALISGLIPLITGMPFMTGLWDGAIPLHLIGLGDLKLGTPLLFDIGVYFVVVGITMCIILALIEED